MEKGRSAMGESVAAKPVRLTSLVKTSGCAAKLDPSQLHQVIDHLPPMHSERLVEGFEGSDDALVWKVTDDIVAIQTVDFFPPMVDDPFTFGQVAAANALSDIYAMGAEPAVAMNLVCFPHCQPLSVLDGILRGGQDKVFEAGAVIAGGHTISDPTPKYGLCVTAFAQKESIWSNSGARVGDVLVFTKKLGVGVLTTAYKGGMIGDDQLAPAVESMVTLNKYARDKARPLQVHAATDVTGFSISGHGMQMADASGVTFRFKADAIPVLPHAMEMARYGMLPEGLYHNLDYVAGHVRFGSGLLQEQKDILVDPETSGGLLLALPLEEAKNLPYPIVGQVEERQNVSVVFD